MVARAETTEATHTRILAAARRLFRELPYDQVTLGTVAHDAGVTVQTVLRRLGSKEALFAAVIARRSVEIRGARDAAPAGDLAGAIGNLATAYEQWGDEMLHFLAQERRTPAVGEAVELGRAYHHAWVERVFAPLLGSLPARQRERQVAQLIAVTDVYTWKILRRDLGLDPEETERALCELASQVLGHPPGASSQRRSI
jgi:AcrR family transcriptional regulator